MSIKEGPFRRRLREWREKTGSTQTEEVVPEKRFYYCDNPLHPYSEIIQVLTYERDPKCPICLRVMTYGRYWR